MKWNKLMITGMSAVALSACGTVDSEETVKDSDTSTSSSGEETAAATDVEGSFTLYTSQPEQDIAQAVVAFNEVHPNITVDVFRSGTEEVISKIMAEKVTGNILADALLVSDSFTFEGLAEEDLLQAYESPELDAVPAEYKDEENLYVGTKVIATGIAVNTDLVDSSEITGFQSMIDAAYADQIMIPSPLYSGSASLNLSIITQQDSLGWDFYDSLKENGLFVGQGNGTVLDALVNGQEGVGMLVDFMANRARIDGAPIEFIYPEEGSLYVTEPIGIINGSENAELAQFFIDYLLSEEGQTVTSEMGYTPVREGIAAPEGLKSIDEITPMDFDATKVRETRDADKEKFAEIFGQE
ncbi:ABC transporter substrate-binding protein [Alkalibacterium sp. 20]|uniref:ABC transporter substrate-binding protein n=1 Tax=Alkalibacterium sp. 20 TaxID=1798803 RepID=UPI0009000354|nr:ABC transporter substrate-binding protein [Alkalibacterium sp. 20]OJF90324.1 ABC transporter substrate-binding protein [Alkalibacterium sp. 20]